MSRYRFKRSCLSEVLYSKRNMKCTHVHQNINEYKTMKKFILGVACMLALGTMSANAQNNNNNCTPQNCVPQTCAPQTCAPQNCAPRGPWCMMESLNLTDAQKTKIQEINKKYADRKRELFNQVRDSKQKNDSVKKSVREQARELKNAKLNDIKNVLTKEQYTQFLENYYLSSPDRGNYKNDKNRHHRHGYVSQDNPRKNSKDGKFGKKGKSGRGDKRSENRVNA